MKENIARKVTLKKEKEKINNDKKFLGNKRKTNRIKTEEQMLR